MATAPTRDTAGAAGAGAASIDVYTEYCSAMKRKQTRTARFNKKAEKDAKVVANHKEPLVTYMMSKGVACLAAPDGEHYVRLQQGKTRIPESITEEDVEASVARITMDSLAEKAEALAKTAANRITAFKRKNGLTPRTSAQRARAKVFLAPVEEEEDDEGSEPAPSKKRSRK